LGVTGEEGANPRLSSVKSTSIYTEPVYSASTIIHSEFASGHDALAASTLEANPVKFDPNDSEIKLKDLSKLVQNVKVDFMDLDSPKYDEPIIVQDEEDVKVHAKSHTETKDTLVPNNPPSPRSKKTKDHGVPSAGQAGTHPAEGEKNTQQVTISQLFQRRIAKDATKKNLNPKPITTTSPITTFVIPPTTTPIIIPTTIQLQSPFLSSPSKKSSQPEGEKIKKDKGKKAMSSKDAEGKETKSDSDDEFNLTGSMVKSSKKKKLKEFYFVTK
nr:hypothetical protein [Tanacetum cinerariifolium]